MEELGPELTENSKSLGRDIANAVYNWSAEDKQGHQAYLHNFEKIILLHRAKVDGEKTMNTPCLLFCHTGEVCPFVIKTDEYIAMPLPPYSTEHNSCILYSGTGTF